MTLLSRELKIELKKLFLFIFLCKKQKFFPIKMVLSCGPEGVCENIRHIAQKSKKYS